MPLKYSSFHSTLGSEILCHIILYPNLIFILENIILKSINQNKFISQNHYYYRAQCEIPKLLHCRASGIFQSHI